jgi:hypothetical protein
MGGVAGFQLAKLTQIVKDIYCGDDFATKLAMKAQAMVARAAKAS